MSQRLYVGNLSFNTTETALSDLFSQHGRVMSASLVTDRETGRSRGFAFVEMSGGGEQAIESCNGVELDGRVLTVNAARARSSRTSTGGLRGGYPRH